MTGLGASHQTGWTATMSALMHLFAKLRPEMLLAPEHVLERLDRNVTAGAPGVHT